MALSIFLVLGDRGDYSDRTVYVVCWYTTRVEAERRAAAMFDASETARELYESAYDDEVIDRARLEIGDPLWSAYDRTEYRVEEIDHGDVDFAIFSNAQLDELYQQLEGESQTFAERAIEVHRLLDQRRALPEER